MQLSQLTFNCLQFRFCAGEMELQENPSSHFEEEVKPNRDTAVPELRTQDLGYFQVKVKVYLVFHCNPRVWHIVDIQ